MWSCISSTFPLFVRSPLCMSISAGGRGDGLRQWVSEMQSTLIDCRLDEINGARRRRSCALYNCWPRYRSGEVYNRWMRVGASKGGGAVRCSNMALITQSCNSHAWKGQACMSCAVLLNKVQYGEHSRHCGSTEAARKLVLQLSFSRSESGEASTMETTLPRYGGIIIQRHPA